MRRATRIAGWIAMTGMVAAPAALWAQAQRKTPYYASISASRARMRTGPGRNYPATWLYQRAGLPIKVVELYHGWRKVQDPDGATGWIQVNLLTDTRTAMVRGDLPAELRNQPSPTARVEWRAEPGVVGRISHCSAGWCWFDVKGQSGYVEIGRLWGVDPTETID